METVVVCVDGSDYTEPSLRFGCWIGERLAASELVVSYVEDIRQYQLPYASELGAGMGLQPCNGLFSEIHKQEQERVQSLQQTVEFVMGQGSFAQKYRFEVEQGRPVDVIQELPEGVGCVVFGKRGERFPLKSEALGANLDRFLRTVSVPCLIASRAFVPVRSVAIFVTSRHHWRRLALFFLANPSFHDLDYHLVHEEKLLGAELEDAVESFRNQGVACRPYSIGRGTEDEFAAYVNEQKCDLIATGTPEGHSLFHWMQTPIAKSMLINCRVPVLYFPHIA